MLVQRSSQLFPQTTRINFIDADYFKVPSTTAQFGIPDIVKGCTIDREKGEVGSLACMFWIMYYLFQSYRSFVYKFPFVSDVVKWGTELFMSAFVVRTKTDRPIF